MSNKKNTIIQKFGVSKIFKKLIHLFRKVIRNVNTDLHFNKIKKNLAILNCNNILNDYCLLYTLIK